jgi:hypothetical protein
MFGCKFPVFRSSNNCQPLGPFHQKLRCGVPAAALLLSQATPRTRRYLRLWRLRRRAQAHVLQRFKVLNDRPAIIRRERRPNHPISSGTIFEFMPMLLFPGMNLPSAQASPGPTVRPKSEAIEEKRLVMNYLTIKNITAARDSTC